jgi:hypothetical protein
VPIFHVIIQRSQQGEARLAYRPPSVESEDAATYMERVAEERLATIMDGTASVVDGPASIVAEPTQRRASQNASKKRRPRNSPPPATVQRNLRQRRRK